VPNGLWQIDGTQVRLAGGERVWVVDILDDHARYLLAALACLRLSGAPAWALLRRRGRAARAAATAALRQRPLLHRPPARLRGRLRAPPGQSRC
jgi:hypothetical protein